MNLRFLKYFVILSILLATAIISTQNTFATTCYVVETDCFFDQPTGTYQTYDVANNLCNAYATEGPCTMGCCCIGTNSGFQTNGTCTGVFKSAVNNANCANICAGGNYFTVSGTVKNNNNLVPSATVILSDGVTSVTQTTNSQGYYEFTNVKLNKYSIRAQTQTGSCDTTLTNIIIDKNSVIPINLACITYNVSGYIFNGFGNIVSGAIITTNTGAQVSSSNDGSYLFTNIIKDTTLTITAKDNTCVGTTTVSVTNNMFNKNIILSCVKYQVSGKITTIANKEVSGAEVVISQSNTPNITGVDGLYQFKELYPGYTTVTASVSTVKDAYNVETCNGTTGSFLLNSNINKDIQLVSCCNVKTTPQTCDSNNNRTVIIEYSGSCAKPPETKIELCSLNPPLNNNACGWDCSGWSACVGNTQSRTCTNKTTPGCIPNANPAVLTKACSICGDGTLDASEGCDYSAAKGLLASTTCEQSWNTPSATMALDVSKYCYIDSCICKSLPVTPVCKWTCSGFTNSACINGIQTQTCTVNTNDPANCVVGPSPQTTISCGTCGNEKLEQNEQCDVNLTKNDLYVSSECMKVWGIAATTKQPTPENICILDTCKCKTPNNIMLPVQNPCELDPGNISSLTINNLFLQSYFNFTWTMTKETCKDYIKRFELSYCDNSSGTCGTESTDYTTIINSSIDKISRIYNESNNLEANKMYCYELKTVYNESVMKNSPNDYTVTKISCKKSGDEDCLSNSHKSKTWCKDKAIVECALNNSVVNKSLCTGNTYCSMGDGEAKCVAQGSCGLCNNIYGLFSYQQIFVNDSGNTLQCPSLILPSPKKPRDAVGMYGKANYTFGCYLDYSMTTLDKVYNCTAVKSCYDYRSEDACNADYCEKFNSTNSTGQLINDCEWIPYTLDTNKLKDSRYGKGICRPKIDSKTQKQDCSKCGKDFIFPACNEEIISLYGVDCYYDPIIGIMDVNNISCSYYATENNCIGNRNASTNVIWNNAKNIKISGTNILTPSLDKARRGVCQWDATRTLNSAASNCYRNADNNAKDDCDIEKNSEKWNNCERDVIPPTTTILNLSIYPGIMDLKGKVKVTDNNNWDIGDEIQDSSKDHILTYYCISKNDGNSKCYPNITLSRSPLSHPYEINLSYYDSISALKDSNSIYKIFYYSQDPAKNLELIKNFTFILDPNVNVSVNYTVKSFNISKSQWVSNISFNLSLISNEKNNVVCSFNLTPSSDNPDYSSLKLGFKYNELNNIPSRLNPTKKIINNTNKILGTTYSELSDGIYDYEMHCIDAVGNHIYLNDSITIEGDVTITKPKPYNEKFTNGISKYRLFPGNISIITNESNAICKYSNYTAYNWDNSNMQFFDGEPSLTNKNIHVAKISLPKYPITNIAVSGTYYYYVACNILINNERVVVYGNNADNPFFVIDNIEPVTQLLYSASISSTTRVLKEYNSSVPTTQKISLYLNCSDDNETLKNLANKSVSFGCNQTMYYCIPKTDGSNKCDNENKFTAIDYGIPINLDYSTKDSSNRTDYGSKPTIYYYSIDIGGNSEFANRKSMIVDIKNTLFDNPIITFNTSLVDITGGVSIKINYSNELIIHNFRAQIVSTNTSAPFSLNITPTNNINGPVYDIDIEYINSGTYKLILNATDSDGNINNNISYFTIKHNVNKIYLISPKTGIGTTSTYEINLSTTFPSTCKYTLSPDNTCGNDIFCKYETILDNNSFSTSENKKIHSLNYNSNTNSGNTSSIMLVICRTKGTEGKDNSNSAFATTNFHVGYFDNVPQINVTYIHKPAFSDPTFNTILNTSYNATTIKLFTNQPSICTIYANYTQGNMMPANILPPTNYFNKLTELDENNYSKYILIHTYFINYSGSISETYNYSINCTNLAQINNITNAIVVLDPYNLPPNLTLTKIESKSTANYHMYNVSCTNYCTNQYQYKKVPQTTPSCTPTGYKPADYTEEIEINESTKVCLIGKDIFGRISYKEQNITLIPFDKGNLIVEWPYQYYASNITNALKVYAPQSEFELKINTQPLNSTCKYILSELVAASSTVAEIYNAPNTPAKIFDNTSNVISNQSTHLTSFSIHAQENTRELYRIICLANDVTTTDPYIRREIEFYWDNTPPTITLKHEPGVYDWNNRISTNITINTDDDTMCVINDTAGQNNLVDTGNSSIFTSYVKKHTYKYLMPNNYNFDTNETLKFNITCINRAKYYNTTNSSVHYEMAKKVIIIKNNTNARSYPGIANSEIYSGSPITGTVIPVKVNTNIMSTCTAYFYNDENNTRVVIPLASANRLYHSIAITTTVSGEHNISIVCNVPENKDILSDTLSYTIFTDTEAPKIISLTGPRNNNSCDLNVFSATIEMSDDFGIAGYNYTITGPAGFKTINNYTSSGNIGTITYNGTLEDKAKYTIRAFAIDLAGKQSAVSSIIINANNPETSIVCDNTPPTITIEQLKYYGNNNVVTLNVTCSDNATLNRIGAVSSCTPKFKYSFMANKDNCSNAKYDSLADYSTKKLIFFNNPGMLCILGQDIAENTQNVEQYLNINSISCGNNVIDAKPKLNETGILSNTLYSNWNSIAYTALTDEECDGADSINQISKTCLTQGFIAGTLSCTSQCKINTSNCNSGMKLTLISPKPFGIGISPNYNLASGSEFDSTCRYGELTNISNINQSYNAMNIIMLDTNVTKTEHLTPINITSSISAPEQYLARNIICKINDNLNGYNGVIDKTYGIMKVYQGYDTTVPNITVTTDKANNTITDWNDKEINIIISSNEPVVCTINNTNYNTLNNHMTSGIITDYNSYNTLNQNTIRYDSLGNAYAAINYSINCTNKAGLSTVLEKIIYYNITSTMNITKVKPITDTSNTNRVYYQIKTNILSECSIMNDTTTAINMTGKLDTVHDATITLANGLNNITLTCKDPKEHVAPINVTYTMTVNTTVAGPYCGDLIINGNEKCDGTSLNGNSCTKGWVTTNYTGGVLKCKTDCSGYDFSSCDNGNGWCGDKKVQGPNTQGTYEQCDDRIPSSLDCKDFGFKSGSLNCNPNCMINTSRCTQENGILGDPSRAVCSNNQLESGEQCETNGKYDILCTAFSYEGGTLTCTNRCSYDLSKCYKAGTTTNGTTSGGSGGGSRCGNNLREGTEQCDGTAIPINTTCKSLVGNYSTGTITCTSACKFNTTKCTTIITNITAACANKVKDGRETDIDCGGGCSACAINKSCLNNSDCLSNKCGTNNKCIVNTCTNGIFDNKTETDTDCGFECKACKLNSKCNTAKDCESGLLCTNKICSRNPCSNGLKDNKEIDVDCGGDCSLCSIGQKCNVNEDCTTSNCVKNLCQEITESTFNTLQLILLILGIIMILSGTGYIIYNKYAVKGNSGSNKNNFGFTTDKNGIHHTIANENKPLSMTHEQQVMLAKQKEAITKKQQSRIKDRKSILDNLDENKSNTKSESNILGNKANTIMTELSSKTNKDNVVKETKEDEYIELDHIKKNNTSTDKDESFNKLKDIANHTNTTTSEKTDSKKEEKETRGKDKDALKKVEASKNKKNTFNRLREIAKNSSSKDLESSVKNLELAEKISKISNANTKDINPILKKSTELSDSQVIQMFGTMDRNTIMSSAFNEVLSELLSSGKITKQNVSNILFEYMDKGLLNKSDVAKISTKLKLI